jgi:hypothetical protein
MFMDDPIYGSIAAMTRGGNAYFHARYRLISIVQRQATLC